jgi:hypothetical protein
MGQAARVTSFQAIQDFKAVLCGFCEEVKEALGTIDMEVRRMLDWLEHDQAHYWQAEVRRRQEEVTQAKADLFRKQLNRLSGEIPDCLEEKDALQIAQRRFDEAEEKIEKCRQWSGRQLPRAIDEYEGPARQLAGMVEGDPPAIVAYLDRVLAALDAYVEVAPPPEIASPPAAPAGTEDGKP